MTAPLLNTPQIGVDLGGTKTALIVLSQDGQTLYSSRRPTPRHDYHATIETITEMVKEAEAEAECGCKMSVGIGMPGSISPHSGLVQNANSTWLNNKPFSQDLALSLGREIKTANDANCLALSEAVDGAAQGAKSVFGVIIGTGCGGGLVHHNTLIQGHRHIGGEWGHTPLPWISKQEFEQIDQHQCWCGLSSCMESWVSGPALAADHLHITKQDITAEALYQLALSGDQPCLHSLSRHTARLARGLAMIVNIFDPEVIVLGGGLSKMQHLYQDLPKAITRYIFSDNRSIDIRAPKHGDASGVRGAARLWQKDSLEDNRQT